MTTSPYRGVLVTGGSGGIGLGLATRWRAAGARVLVTGRDPDRLRAAAAAGLETLVSDIGDPADREELAARVMPELDAVVHNAGIQRRVPIAADHAPWADVQTELDILLGGPVHLTRLLLPRLLESGRPGLIVTVTSGGAYAPQPFAPVYSAAKAALHSYTVNLRYALAATPVRVVELVPPAVATGLAGGGVDVGTFCDAVFPRLDGSTDQVGFGATGSEPFTAVMRAQDTLFAAAAGRVPVDRF
jgi:uncharacterized oxidoreductase